MGQFMGGNMGTEKWLEDVVIEKKLASAEEARKKAGEKKARWREKVQKVIDLERERQKFRNTLKDRCSCGVEAPWALSVHHIDGNSKNNDEGNLEVLCYNCHASRHLRKTVRPGERPVPRGHKYYWKYATECLTPRDEIPDWRPNKTTGGGKSITGKGCRSMGGIGGV